MPGRLSGKVCIVTGTGGSMGRATALTFAREGALVVGCDVAVEPAEETRELVKAAGGEMVSLQPCVLSDPAECARLVDLAVSEFGRRARHRRREQGLHEAPESVRRSNDRRHCPVSARRQPGSHSQTVQAWRTAERANSSADACGSALARTSSQSSMYSPSSPSQRAAGGESVALANPSGAGWAYA